MYTKIFDEIISITHNDYAGCLDKRGWDNPEKYRSDIQTLEEKDALTPVKFTEIVEDYLLDFKDRHMPFRLVTNDMHKEYNIGFKVRRYEDKLYVVSIGKEKRLQIGDAIIALDGIPILKLVDKHQRELAETEAEREEWESILKHYTYCEVTDASKNQKSMQLKKYEKEEYVSNYSIERLNGDTLLMMLSDFINLDAIPALIKQYENELTATKNLIIDVRNNRGGNGSAYDELLPYLFPLGLTTLDFKDEYGMKYNCTHRNYELTMKHLKLISKDIKDEKLLQYMKQFEKEFHKNKGNGFAALDILGTQQIEGKKCPEHVVILSDVHCASAGEHFIEACKKSQKVTVIGRPTAGVNDYSNLTIMEWEGLFELWYPTSRLDKIDKEGGEISAGVKPDICIPWTPGHVTEDVDVKKALELFKG